MKVKNIKSKVEAKVAKAKNKTVKKCGRGRKACACAVALVSCLASLVLTGCMWPSAPSRSQSLNMRDCTVYVFGGGAETGDVARVEIASQAMAIETSGTESQTVSPTQTVDTKPEVAVGVGGSSASTGKGGTATQSGKFAAIGAGVDAAASMLPSGGKAEEKAEENRTTKENSVVATENECADGACCPDGACRE